MSNRIRSLSTSSNSLLLLNCLLRCGLTHKLVFGSGRWLPVFVPRNSHFLTYLQGMTDEGLTVEQFRRRCVEPMGEESDHVHIVALTDALQVWLLEPDGFVFLV